LFWAPLLLLPPPPPPTLLLRYWREKRGGIEGRERELHCISIERAVFFLVRVDGPEPIWNSVTGLSLSLSLS